MSGILLDTCAVVWTAEGAPLAPEAQAALDDAYRQGEPVRVSPITAWEIGLLMARGRLSSALDPQDWFARFMASPGLALSELSPRTLIASSFLPASPPRDPADRIIVATARANRYRVMTRDRLLLDYAAQGHLQVVAC